MPMRSSFRRHVDRPAALGPLGAVGMVLGHWLSYLLAAPRATVRARLLAATGHGYWLVAVRAAVVCAVAALAGVLIRAMAERLRGEAPGSGGPGATAVALGAIQVGGYVAMEVVERLVARAPLSTLLVHDVLVLGVLIQIGLAGLLSLALWWLRRAADRLVTLALPDAVRPRRRTLAIVSLPTDVVPVVRLVSGHATRAPPNLLVGTAR
jgi:hypothetical protein